MFANGVSAASNEANACQGTPSGRACLSESNASNGDRAGGIDAAVLNIQIDTIFSSRVRVPASRDASHQMRAPKRYR